MMTGYFYVTLRCNAMCEFCQVWRGAEYQDIRISEYREPFEALKKSGIRDLIITGGEPLLREDLSEILKSAKEFQFNTTLITNGILYSEKAQDLNGLADKLIFSLDYPIADEHNRSRGVDCFHQVIQGIKLAKSRGENTFIKFTMTRDSVRFLPEMVELSDKLGVPVILNPVYDFYGTHGFERSTLEHIKYYRKRKNVILNLAVLEFIKDGGNRTYFPRCRASETTVTILPDGGFASPCFFNQGGKQGREDICSSCTRWPYMLPSFAKGFDKYFWLNALSGINNRRKGEKI